MGAETGSRARRGGHSFVASVVIPAHNEAAVIAGLLRALREGVGPGDLEVVVACNGCTDETATIARDHGAIVVDVPEASKTAALNAADAVATTFPRAYVDADVVIPGHAIVRIAEHLSGAGALFASPPVEVDVRGRPWPVRAFFKVWQRTPYVRERQVGSGVLAFSSAGRARFDEFPDVVADDLFARDLFARSERAVVATEPVVVQAPWTLAALLTRRIRVYAGNLEIAARTDLPWLPAANEPRVPWWRAVVEQPSLAPPAVVYASINTVAQVVARRRTRRGGPIDWGRDSTTRGRAGAENAPGHEVSTGT
jgi:glycosyltransferase involved in cell wall biosynthesis